jgi:bifunctional oligoribonuclease and PAP phosphatase NrnA
VNRPAVQLPDDAWAEAIRLLRGAPDALLVCHVAPDGDALGSMLALARALRANGTVVTCTWGDARWTVPAPYSWLPDLDTVISPVDVPTEPSLLVVLDTSSRDRLGVLAELPERSGGVVVIDHHAHSGEHPATKLPGVHLVDAASAATAVVVEELLRRMSVELDPTTATLLYVGLVTDTGSFQHSVTTDAVHGVAGRLLAAGVQPDAVARALWGTKPFAFQHVLGVALTRAQLEADGVGGRGLVWTVVAQDELLRTGLTLDDVESVIDVIRSAEEADVAIVLKQDVDGSFRVSTRSRGGTDVGAACVALGGGGHRLAAGFTSFDDIDTTMKKLRVALDQSAQQ